MIELTPLQRRELRAQAHPLNPVVSISQKGLQPSVLNEIDRCLTSHELIKVRLYGIERETRDALISELCGSLGCASVQHIGNLLVLWRKNPESAEDGGKSALAGRRPRSTKPVTKKQAAASQDARGKSRPTNPRRRSST